MHRQSKALAQVFGENLHLVRLYSFRPAHTQGQTDHNFSYVVLLNHVLQLFKVISFIPSLKGLQPLCRDPQRIGHGHADTPRAHI